MQALPGKIIDSDQEKKPVEAVHAAARDEGAPQGFQHRQAAPIVELIAVHKPNSVHQKCLYITAAATFIFYWTTAI